VRALKAGDLNNFFLEEDFDYQLIWRGFSKIQMVIQFLNEFDILIKTGKSLIFGLIG